MCRHLGYDPERILATTPQRGSERILELAIRSGPYGDHYGERDGLTLDDFKADAHGILVGEAESSVPVSTASGKVELAPAYLLDDIPRLRKAIAEHRRQTYLVSQRTLRSMHSWMNNVTFLSRGTDRCPLLLHHNDAAAPDVVNTG